jgi:hypothetical protein
MVKLGQSLFTSVKASIPLGKRGEEEERFFIFFAELVCVGYSFAILYF